MGNGIAHVFAINGFEVRLFRSTPTDRQLRVTRGYRFKKHPAANWAQEHNLNEQ